MFSSDLSVNMVGHLVLRDSDTKAKLLDKRNAIHPRNMARIIARALSREGNSYIHRIAFGNGGTVTDPTGAIIFNPTNDGRDGSWESRLYNETYSEIVDDTNVDFGSDPGSAEPGNIRTGGGAVPEDDPSDGGVYSQEVGLKSNIIIRMTLNKNEPSGQLNTINDFGLEISDSERTFIFDEIGLYSSGKQAAATSAYTSVNVNNKTSEDVCLLDVSTSYTLDYIVNSNNYQTTITTPAGGSGPAGALTYGDVCEGLNSGSWITSGDNFSSVAYVFITDRTGGLSYPTINNKESYGFLTFQALSSGSSSTIEILCNDDPGDFFTVISNNICDNVNVNNKNGEDAGVINDSADPSNERERLLTHITFPPISKTADKSIDIEYTITVSVARTTDSRVNQVLPP